MALIEKCKNEKKVNNLLYLVIIFLLVIIAFLAFFIGKNTSSPKVITEAVNTNSSWEISNTNFEPITITVIDDKRCKNCYTDEIVGQLKMIPFFTWSEITVKDFGDSWVEKYLKDNEIKFLPAVILSSNKINDNWEMQAFLKQLKDNQYSLDIWAKYDPLAKRSEKWFLVVEKDILNKIKENSYIKWNKDAKITWLEYSDLECPYCAKLHQSDVSEKINEKYKDQINVVFNHFPLDFHKNALSWALVMECLWEQKWWNAFYSLMKTSFETWKSELSYLVDEAVKLWANKANLEKCVNDWKYNDKIKEQQANWTNSFWVTWTPWNVLINNETWEYEVLSWAYPFENFEQIINSLLWIEK